MKEPIRVLHVINRLDMGGVETWLLNVVKNLPATGYQFDFFTVSPGAAALDHEIVSLGCRLFKAKALKPSVFSIYCDLKKVVRENGPYDVIHSHVHHFSGVIVLLASIFKIPVRMVHSHNDTRIDERSQGVLRHAYVGLMRIFVRLFATRGIGVSSVAAEDQFGIHWSKDPRWEVLPCGIDFKRFDIPRDTSLASSLKIPAGAKVIGHVGRFDKQKNHRFLIDVFGKLLDRGNNVFLLLVGEGPLRKEIQERVICMGLSGKVLFWSAKCDVPNLLRSVIDVFIFPSLYEGLGLAFIEAQLAGCYCLGSDVLPKEVVIASERVVLLSLQESLDTWAAKAEPFFSHGEKPEAQDVLNRYKNSHYELKTGMQKMLTFYNI